MSDPITTIPLQIPTATNKNALALQPVVNGNPFAVEYVIPSHPTPLDTEWVFTTAATDVQLSAAPGAGKRLAITQFSVLLSADATVNARVRVGWGATTLQAESAGGVGGMVVNHTLTPGGGIIKGNGGGIVNLGPANTPLRMTCTVPTGGRLIFMITCFFPEIA